MKTEWSSINWGKGFSILLLLAFVFMLVPAIPSFANPARIQPLLVKLAETNPDSSVSVIVQKTVKDSHVEDAVTRLGGTVTKDLSIINAFAAEIKVHDVLHFAKASGVKWISLDGPMVASGGPDGNGDHDRAIECVQQSNWRGQTLGARVSRKFSRCRCGG